MLRGALFMILASLPAHAWEFSPTPVCTLSGGTDAAKVQVTYDPSKAQPYAIDVTRQDAPWPEAPSFSIRFEGPTGFTISTDRQTLSENRRRLSVTDTGFRNVLDGLEYADSATAISGADRITVPLAGAAAPVRAFRDCSSRPVS